LQPVEIAVTLFNLVIVKSSNLLKQYSCFQLMDLCVTEVTSQN